ncbi:hypothetical protein AB834_06285 [PVC group bacterium (ex Bugula neritina AB1)]|nr:hypothetical protein AB834_06285 [PVC group bacterium (ex Bugula neritina AB1)]
MIWVLYGGNSSEKNISLKSGKAVHKALMSRGYKVELVDCDWKTFPYLDFAKCDLAFIMMHGGVGESGHLQEFLAKKNVSFTGPDAYTCWLFFNKLISKSVFLREGIMIPQYIALHSKNMFERVPEFEMPWFVKPISQGSSFGVSLVEKKEDYQKALFKALEYDDILLVEKKVEGREMVLSVVDGEVLDPIEIISNDRFFDYHAKYYSTRTNYICAPEINDEEKYLIKKMVAKILNSFSLKNLFRLDFILSKEGPYVLEINTVPGFTERSLVPLAASYRGVSFEDLCVRIVNNSLKKRTE